MKNGPHSIVACGRWPIGRAHHVWRGYGATCAAAGLDVCNLHNAMVGLHYGKPWREVDYSKARLAQRQERELFAASKILDRWCERVRPV